MELRMNCLFFQHSDKSLIKRTFRSREDSMDTFKSQKYFLPAYSQTI